MLDRYAGLSSHIKVETKDPVLYPNFVSRYTSENLSENSVLVVGQNRSKAVDYYDIYQYSMDYSTYSSSLSSFDGEGQILSLIHIYTAAITWLSVRADRNSPIPRHAAPNRV